MRSRAPRAALACFLGLALGACEGAKAEEGETLAKIGVLPPFALTSHRGAPFTEANLRGKVSVVNFIFTACPSICPMITARAAALQPELRSHEGKAQLVSISVDPGADTPEVLTAYAAKHGADPDLWTFVTGDTRAVATVVEQGFRVSVSERQARGDGRYDILHASHFALVDADGVLRGFFASDDAGEVELRQAVRRLVKAGGR